MKSHLQVQEMIGRYCWHVDRGEWPEWLALFSEDAVWGARGSRLFEGMEALRKLATGLAKRAETAPPSRHIISNILVELGDEVATLRAYALVVNAPDGAVQTIGDYDMTLIRRGDGWRIARMIFNPAIAADE